MEFNSFGRKSKPDPLLFDCDDKDALDSLLETSDRNSFADIDLDALDPNVDLGHWLQNSSLSQLTTHLDTDHDASLTEGNLLPVNPESIMPVQPAHREMDSEIDTVNSAAMRLHANCSDVEDIKTVLVQQQIPQQSTQHIQLVAVPVTVSKGNISCNTTPIHSPLKANTIILDSTFSVAGTTYIASPQKLQTVSSGNQKSRNILTPSQCSPVLVGHLQSGVSAAHRPITVTVSSPLKHTNLVQHHTHDPQRTVASLHHPSLKMEDKVYPKPVFSYSCLIALALKNSKTGNLPVSEIYNFMCENFPYFKTAPDGWKNSVRHNLSLNKCFAKVDNPKLSSGAKKGCLWALNPAKVKKMEEEITKWGKKDPATLLNSMAYPENLEAIEKGQAGLPFRKDSDSDEDENMPSPLPATPVKKEIASTLQKQTDNYLSSELMESPLHQFDMDQEYVAHAIQWGVQDTDMEDINIDLLTNSPLTSSPVTTLPHTPSRSVAKLGIAASYNGSFFTSSPSRHQANASPSSVRMNLFGITPPRTLSALN